MNAWPDLRAVLADVPWVIVGGVATRAYMAERMTQDLDILVRTEDGERAVTRMLDAGFEPIGNLSIPGRSMRSPEGTEVDVLFGDQPWLAEALSNPERDQADFPVIALPFLIVLKLQAARTQDWADVARMLGQADDDRLAAVRAVVRRWSPEDGEDLEALIYLGREEMRSAGE